MSWTAKKTNVQYLPDESLLGTANAGISWLCIVEVSDSKLIQDVCTEETRNYSNLYHQTTPKHPNSYEVHQTMAIFVRIWLVFRSCHYVYTYVSVRNRAAAPTYSGAINCHKLLKKNAYVQSADWLLVSIERSDLWLGCRDLAATTYNKHITICTCRECTTYIHQTST